MSASRLLEANPECWRKCSALGVPRGTLSPRDPLERGPHPVRVGATSGRPQDVGACEMALRVGRGQASTPPKRGAVEPALPPQETLGLPEGRPPSLRGVCRGWPITPEAHSGSLTGSGQQEPAPSPLRLRAHQSVFLKLEVFKSRCLRVPRPAAETPAPAGQILKSLAQRPRLSLPLSV